MRDYYDRSLFSTQYAKVSGMGVSLDKVTKFLLLNRSVVLSEETMERIFGTRISVNTPLSNIFKHLSGHPCRNMFTGILPSSERNTSEIPDLLALPSITLDLRGSTLPASVKSLPEYNDKILINLSGLIRPTGYGDTYEVSDFYEIQSLMIRGALCRSYTDVKFGYNWLSPSLSKFIIESYAVILSSQLVQTFALDFVQQMQVAAFFALYMSQKIANSNDPFPQTFWLSTFLGDRKVVDEFVSTHRDTITDTLTLSDTCDLIATHGSARMRNFDLRMLNQICSRIGSDNISNMIALEYPPYWVQQVLLAISAGKSTILAALKRYRLLEPAKTFANSLSTATVFLNTLDDDYVKPK